MTTASAKDVPLLPKEDAREAALFFVVAALCFLAALAALSARASYTAADNWTSQVEGEMTIRLKAEDRRAADEARNIIEETSGVANARVLDRSETEALLTPWFGVTGLPAGLPLPVLIAASAEPGIESPTPDIARKLAERGFEAVVDNHEDFAADIRRGLGALRLTALGAIALLSATAVSVIAFATHAALLARRDIVEILHLSGAQDRFIAALFERRFWLLGLQAGSVGALAALGTAALLIFGAQSTGNTGWLLPRLRLDLLDLSILFMTPVIAAIAARIATRTTVLRALAETI